MMEKSINKKNIITPSLGGALISVFIVGILTVFLANKNMPTAEGWYSYYAKCILNGEIVYADFEYLFTPIYMYFIAGFIKVFGFNILTLRILGILIYAILTLIIFSVLNRVFSTAASVVGTITGIFYLQSEVYTVFYDYVRVMDICAYLSILFMVVTIIQWKDHFSKGRTIYLWGMFTSLFFLIKQNMGGLFLVYSVLLIVFCGLFYYAKIKQIFISLIKFAISFIIPVLILGVILLYYGIADDMINSVLFGAVEAKGGLLTILFRWIGNGLPSFSLYFLCGVLYFLILLINQKLSGLYPIKNSYNKIMICFYSIVTSIIVVLLCMNEELGKYFSEKKRLDINMLFMFTVVLLFILLGYSLYNIVKHIKLGYKILLIISLLGSYFSLCYGAGMSGGLSIGESALGLGVIICIFFDSFKYYVSWIPKIGIICYCMYLSFGCIAFKLVYPCEWWGIDETSVYEADHYSSIPLLSGIRLSEKTKKLYEDVVNAVITNTNSEDNIFCFPHIPIFYLLCDRDDCGTYTKVQWFDVSTKETLYEDIDKITQNLPKAFIIYNLNDGAYNGHEDGFFSGEESGTRKMRDSIYTIVNTFNYKYQGTFVSDDNNISVFTWRNSDNDTLDKNLSFSKGNGTKESPYIIDSVEALVNFAMMVNQGEDFENIYFLQTTDLDLSDIIWVPVGYTEKCTFKGNYEQNGYEIVNINCGDKNTDVPFGTDVFVSTN